MDDFKEGYKIVAVDEQGDYYSSVMGIKYIENEPIEIPEKQKAIDINWAIADVMNYAFDSERVGKTSIFIVGKNGKPTERDVCTAYRMPSPDRVRKGYNIKIVKAKVYKNISIRGYVGLKIALGMYIEFLDKWSWEKKSNDKE